MGIAFIVISLIFIILQLYACRTKSDKLRRLTKPFLVPTMTSACLLSLGSGVLSGTPLYLLIAAMTLYTIGDILLIPEGKPYLFIAGMFSFILGHVMIAISAARTGFSFVAMLVSIVIWFMILFMLFFPRLDKDNKMTPYLKLYGTVIAVYGVVVSSSYFLGSLAARILGIAGVAMFAISDSMIAMEQTDGKDRNTSVMATYILAVALLLLSFFVLYR